MPQIKTDDIHVVYQYKDIDNQFPLCYDNKDEATSYADEMNTRYSYTELQPMDVFKVCTLSNYIFKYGDQRYDSGYSCGETDGYSCGETDGYNSGRNEL